MLYLTPRATINTLQFSVNRKLKLAYCVFKIVGANVLQVIIQILTSYIIAIIHVSLFSFDLYLFTKIVLFYSSVEANKYSHIQRADQSCALSNSPLLHVTSA